VNSKNTDNHSFLEIPIPITDQKWKKNRTPVVSISCTTYNHEKYIKDTIEGFLKQKTTFPVEINIHDDASTDNTANIIREYEEKYPQLLINPIYQSENQYSKKDGTIRRIQHGRAKGKYYATCEGDDYWTDPLKLQKQVELMEENENIGFVHTGYKIKNSINDETYNHIKDIKNPVEDYMITGDMRTLTVLYRSKFLNDIKSVFNNPRIKKAPYGDRPTFLTIASKSGVGYIPDVTGVYRRYPGPSATRNTDIVGKYKKIIKNLEVNKELLKILSIENNRFKLNLEWRLFKNRCIVKMVEFNLFKKIYHFLYHKLGMGANKDERYY